MTVDVNGFISCMRTVILENGLVCTLGNFLENAGKKIVRLLLLFSEVNYILLA